MSEKMEFPILGKHAKCPECGCEEDLIKKTVDKLKEEGVVKESLPVGGGLGFPLQLFEQQDLPKILQTTLVGKPKVPVLTVRLTICAECHHVDLMRVDFVEQEIQVQVQAPPGRQAPPFGGMPPRYG